MTAGTLLVVVPALVVLGAYALGTWLRLRDLEQQVRELTREVWSYQTDLSDLDAKCSELGRCRGCCRGSCHGGTEDDEEEWEQDMDATKD